MIQNLIELDYTLLYLINQKWAGAGTDWFLPFWTDLHKTWFFQVILLPMIFLVTYWKAKQRGLGLVLLTLALVSFTDFLNSSFLKPFFARPRPAFSELPFEVILRGPEHLNFSFPSSHSLDIFSATVFLSIFVPALRWPLLLLASLTAYSRVYCGVHFPSDVLAGAILGSLFGWGAARSYQALRRLKTSKPEMIPFEK